MTRIKRPYFAAIRFEEVVFEASFGLIVEEIVNRWSAVKDHPTSLSDTLKLNGAISSGTLSTDLDYVANGPLEDMMHSDERRYFP